MADKKIKCLECGKMVHIIVPHLLKTHRLQPGDYLDKHLKPDQDPKDLLWSSEGLAALKETHPNGFIAKESRKRVKVPLATLLPDFGRPSKVLAGDYEIFAEPTDLTPKRNPKFVFPEKLTLEILTGLAKPERNRIWVFGPSGVGKTLVVSQVAHLLNAELMIFNGDGYVGRSELIGRFMVKGGEVIFMPGLIIRAMQAGAILLFNELDTLSSMALNVIKPVLEDPSYLPVPEIGETIRALPTFRVISTNNTGGFGDSSGHFGNVNRQSAADIRRWNIMLEVGYLKEKEEVAVLLRYFPDVPIEALTQFVVVANKIRSAEKLKEGIDKTLSLDELINWVENWLVYGYTAVEAAEISFLNPLDIDTKAAIKQLIIAVFGKE